MLDEVGAAIWPHPQQAGDQAAYCRLQEEADRAIRDGDVNAARKAALAAARWLIANDADFEGKRPEDLADDVAELAARNTPPRLRDLLRLKARRLYRRFV